MSRVQYPRRSRTASSRTKYPWPEGRDDLLAQGWSLAQARFARECKRPHHSWLREKIWDAIVDALKYCLRRYNAQVPFGGYFHCWANKYITCAYRESRRPCRDVRRDEELRGEMRVVDHREFRTPWPGLKPGLAAWKAKQFQGRK